MTPALRKPGMRAASSGSGFASAVISASAGSPKRALTSPISAPIVSGEYMLGVPPPKNSVRARTSGALAISARSAPRYRAARASSHAHFAKSQYGQTYGQNGRCT